MPSIIGKKVTVVDNGGIQINELAGNVATRQDTISIAQVTVSQANTSEPWLTLDYDEWICVIKGTVELHYGDNEVLEVNAGETVFLERGERFRPFFPIETEYIPVCLPAFTPERCKREEEPNSAVSTRLKELHSKAKQSKVENSDTNNNYNNEEEVLYHMCQKSLWQEAVDNKTAYFPPTFKEDGMFTHATAVPERLITTANHFYTFTKGDWICLQLSRKALYQVGIDTVFEQAKPVGETGVGEEWGLWVCPHIYGGIPTTIDGIVTETFEMKREADGTFVCIVGLTDK